MALGRLGHVSAWATLLFATAAGCSSNGGKSKVDEHVRSSASALSAIGTEQCDQITPTSFTPILTLLGEAKVSALLNLQAHPDGDAETLRDSIDLAIQRVSGSADWLKSAALDGTNASVAMSTQWSTADAIAPIATASQSATRAAMLYGSIDARNAFNSLTQAALAANELGTAAGRCALDIYGNLPDSATDWRKGVRPETAAATPPDVSGTCGEIGVAALEPLSTLLASAIAHEQAEIDAYPNEGYTEYAQADIDIAREQSNKVQALRDSLAASSDTAATPATARAIQDLASGLASSVLGGGVYSVETATDLPGEGRSAFEADVTAGEYALRLAAAAGRCAMEKGFVQQVFGPYDGPPLPLTNYLIQLDAVDVEFVHDKIYEGNYDPYLEYATLAVDVKHSDHNLVVESVPYSCTLGPAVPTGGRLDKCIDDGSSKNLKNTLLQHTIQVTDPADTVRVAIALDNIRASPTASTNPISTGLSVDGNVLAAAGTIIAASSQAAAVPGAIVGVIAAAVSIAGTLTQGNAQDPNYCAGGLMGLPDPVAQATYECIGSSDAPCAGKFAIVPNKAPDTLLVDFTADKLAELTQSGDAVLSFTTSMIWPTQLWQYEAGACDSSHTIRLRISRDWRTGLAPSPKSGDGGFARGPDEVNDITTPVLQVPRVHRRYLDANGWNGPVVLNPDFEEDTVDATALSEMQTAAISRRPDLFDTFWVDEKSRVRSAYWSEAAGYNLFEVPPAEAPAPHALPPPFAHLTVAARKPGNLDVFWVAADEAIYQASWSDTTKWTTARISDPGLAVPGSGIAAVARNPDQLDVFFAKKDGAVASLAWHEGDVWKPITVSPPGLASVSSTSNITATARTASSLDVFFIGANGSIYQSSWFDGAPNWLTTNPALGVADALPGQAISSVSSHADAQAIAFAAHGNLYVSRWAAGRTEWSTEVVAGISETDAFSGEFPISIVSRDRWNLDVFFKDAWLNPWAAHWHYGFPWTKSMFQ
jgi:hypothetical protein